MPDGQFGLQPVRLRGPVTELALEFQWVGNVGELFTNLRQPLTYSSEWSYAGLNAVEGTVETSLKAPSGSDVASNVLWVLSETFDLFSYLSGDEAEPVLGVSGAVTGLAAIAATNSDGSSVLWKLQSDVSQLGLSLSDSYVNTLLAYDNVEAIILSDYRKLSIVGQGAQSDPRWSRNVQTSTAQAVDALEAATTRWSYGQLMPIAWDQWIVPNTNNVGGPVTPYEPQYWICSGGPPWYYPFAKSPADGTGWFLAYLASGSPPMVGPVMWMLGDNKSSFLNQAQFAMPSQTLTDAMNASFGSNLLLQAQFWAREFDPQTLNHAKYFLSGCSD